MSRGNVKKKEFEPVGPFEPPYPKTVDDMEGAEPMAVANDKQTPQDSFMPTTQRDAENPMNHELAQKYRVDRADRTGGAAVQEAFTVGGRAANENDEETRRQQDPPGFKDAPMTGFRELDDSEE